MARGAGAGQGWRWAAALHRQDALATTATEVEATVLPVCLSRAQAVGGGSPGLARGWEGAPGLCVGWWSPHSPWEETQHQSWE